VSQDGLDRLRQIAVGFQQAKILLAAAELGVFDHLVGGASAPAVARALGADGRATEILLDALVAIDIVAKRDGTYRTRPDLEPLLVEDAPTHFVASLRHQNRLFRQWAFLEERVLGQPVPSGLVGAPTDADHENFIRAMYAITHRQADTVVARIGLDAVRSIADLGGGPGHYLAALMRRAPHADAYLVDLAPTLAVASRVQAANPDWPRVHLVEWDFYAGDPPPALPALDLAFVSQVVHSESPEANRAFFRRLFPVISPGGRLVVHERVVEPDRTAPLEAATFAVNMLVMTAGGRSYTAQEIAEWGTAVGFVHERDVRISDRSHLTVLRKPRA
jgi:SAM-dependent methyltransferase